MIIDTDKISGWVKIHSRICIPVATGFLSWFAATRWQVAYRDPNGVPLDVFYFCVSASSGIFTVMLVVFHITKFGWFNDDEEKT